MSTKVAQKAAAAQTNKPKKPKSCPANPPFKQMIVEAINHLNDAEGSSRIAIRKAIEAKHSPKNLSTFLNKTLAKMVKSEQLKNPKKHPGKYQINLEKVENKVVISQKKKEVKKSKPTQRKPQKKSAAGKKTKSPAKKRKAKSPKKSPVKKTGSKKVKAPASRKPAPKGKKGRGRPKKK